jgi:hypothetical protein
LEDRASGRGGKPSRVCRLKSSVATNLSPPRARAQEPLPGLRPRAPAFGPCISSCAEACRVMSHHCPFCHVVHGRICVSLQYPSTYRGHWRRRDDPCAGPGLCKFGPGLGRGQACALGPRETMVAANKRPLGPGPGGVPAWAMPVGGRDGAHRRGRPRPSPDFCPPAGKVSSVTGLGPRSYRIGFAKIF